MPTDNDHPNEETDAMRDASHAPRRELSESTTLLHADLEALRGDVAQTHKDALRARQALERVEAEAPTRGDHGSPCATLLSHIQALASVSMRVGIMLGIVGTAAAVVVTAAIWLMARSDAGDEASRLRDAELGKGANERNVAISSLQTEVRVELSAVKATLARNETKLDALLASRQQPLTIP